MTTASLSLFHSLSLSDCIHICNSFSLLCCLWLYIFVSKYKESYSLKRKHTHTNRKFINNVIKLLVSVQAIIHLKPRPSTYSFLPRSRPTAWSICPPAVNLRCQTIYCIQTWGQCGLQTLLTAYRSRQVSVSLSRLANVFSFSECHLIVFIIVS